MSKYTTEVRFICETKSGFSETELKSKTVDQIIDASRSTIFNFEYPIYESSHKPELEKKILKHYYTREIAGETYALWQLWLNEKLNLIMPKYNKLYKAEHDILNKELKNVDIVTENNREDDFTRTDNLHEGRDFTRTDNLHEGRDLTRTDNLHEEFDSTRTDNLTHTNSHNDLNTRKFSDTPQGSITFSEANEQYYWLTDYTEENNTGGATDTNTGTQRNAGSIDNTGTQRNAGSVDNTGTQRNAGSVDNTGTQRNAGTSLNDGTESGYRGAKVYAELMEAYAQKVVNIDAMIINDLRDLFFKLW